MIDCHVSTAGAKVRVKSARFRDFKRYTDTTISGIPSSARLVVLAGPNGSGKSSLFDGMRTWHAANGAVNYNWDETYGHKVGTPRLGWPDHIQMEFHEELPEGVDERKKMIYTRSAFRNEADFTVNNFARVGSPLDNPRIQRLIDNDVSVSDNYQRLIMLTIDGVYDNTLPDEITKGELRDRIIGQVRAAMLRVFPDLQLTGVGGIGGGSTADVGTFYFDKGAASGFLYKNLSAGEKAAFDLLLDTVIKREYYDNTVWCIDEPEAHLSTRIQSTLLQTLLDLLPARCQLWIASHSIGFMRKAWELAGADPGSVVFIDLQNKNFDESVSLTPIEPTRDFWRRTLDVALGDVASLVAPERVVLCEGRPARGESDHKAAFDATCYQRIFASEFPGTDFMSVGNSNDAGQDRLEIGTAIQALAAGTEVVRLVDKDMRTDAEVKALIDGGVRVLSRRHLEAYLLDDEVIAALCRERSQPEKIADAHLIMREELAASVARGNDPDDYKSAGGSFYTRVRRLLSLTGAGGTWDAFARDTLAPLVHPDMKIYQLLRNDVFDTPLVS